MDQEIFFQYLSKFISLTPDEKDILIPFLKHRKYLKGQYIVQQGDICNYDSFVIKGCLRTYHVDQRGQEHVIRFAIENWWTADMGSFINKTPADYNVQCLENTDVFQFSSTTLEEIFNQIPKFESFFRLIIQNAFVASEKRIVRNFSLDARERYLAFSALYPRLDQRIPQYMIASYLGITKQYLSEIRNQLAHE
ncbi:Crp/Fnr family transcriptional regulator [Aquimarina algiphila]|uniref:Crp/Fnr family transcriptional regulator n=1 Tax=Aquimarina algiphila TaxID=2047982 RepID=UPI00232DAD72|nr:Crp/Fnr family transcriptional regulator [Aquimarina algiphila]